MSDDRLGPRSGEGTVSGRYQHFHQQGRWQGLPLRVEVTEAEPRFEPILEASELGPALLVYGVPNSGMMAGQPTNVYLLGDVPGGGPLTLVDAGAADGVEMLTRAIENSGIAAARIVRLVLTHCHPDHVGGAAAVRDLTGAAVVAHRLEKGHIERWAGKLPIDTWIDDSVPLTCEGFELLPIFTPGHSPGHLCFVESRSHALLAGDMISGFGSVGIFPPEGSMSDYISSLRRLRSVHDELTFSGVCPGHGPLIADAGAKIDEYIEHRLAREAEVVAALANGPASIDDLLPVIYPDVLPHLSFAARSTLQAHLEKLVDDRRVTTQDGRQFRLQGD